MLHRYSRTVVVCWGLEVVTTGGMVGKSGAVVRTKESGLVVIMTVVMVRAVVTVATAVGVVLLRDSVVVLMFAVAGVSSVAVVSDGVSIVMASSAMSVSGGKDVALGEEGPGDRGMVVAFEAGCVGAKGKVVVLESDWEDSGVALTEADGLILEGKEEVPLFKVSETVGVMSH